MTANSEANMDPEKRTNKDMLTNALFTGDPADDSPEERLRFYSGMKHIHNSKIPCGPAHVAYKARYGEWPKPRDDIGAHVAPCWVWVAFWKKRMEFLKGAGKSAGIKECIRQIAKFTHDTEFCRIQDEQSDEAWESCKARNLSKEMTEEQKLDAFYRNTMRAAAIEERQKRYIRTRAEADKMVAQSATNATERVDCQVFRMSDYRG